VFVGGGVVGVFLFFRREGEKNEVFSRVEKGQALLQVLVCGRAFEGLANVPDPEVLLS
jgi:hypothetical protein